MEGGEEEKLLLTFNQQRRPCSFSLYFFLMFLFNLLISFSVENRDLGEGGL